MLHLIRTLTDFFDFFYRRRRVLSPCVVQLALRLARFVLPSVSPDALWRAFVADEQRTDQALRERYEAHAEHEKQSQQKAAADAAQEKEAKDGKASDAVVASADIAMPKPIRSASFVAPEELLNAENEEEHKAHLTRMQSALSSVHHSGAPLPPTESDSLSRFKSIAQYWLHAIASVVLSADSPVAKSHRAEHQRKHNAHVARRAVEDAETERVRAAERQRQAQARQAELAAKKLDAKQMEKERLRAERLAEAEAEAERKRKQIAALRLQYPDTSYSVVVRRGHFSASNFLPRLT